MYGLLLVLAAAGASFGATGRVFEYDLEVEPKGYALRMELRFPPSVSLDRVVADLRDPSLMHRLHPAVEPLVIAPGPSGTYESILTVRSLLGLVRTRLASRCREEGAPGGERWSRRCELDASKLDAGKVVALKLEETSCARVEGGVDCTVRVSGLLKDAAWFLKANELTMRAKAQAIENWGRLWAYIGLGSASARLSNAAYEAWELSRDVEALKTEGLRAAREAEAGKLAFRRRGGAADPGTWP